MRTILDFDEIHKLGNDLAKRHGNNIDILIDSMIPFLLFSYLTGAEAAGEMLGAPALAENVGAAEMYMALYEEIDGKNFADRLKEGSDPSIVLETESHRLLNRGITDAARTSGLPDIKKTWVTMRDERVRDTHDYLEGMSVGFDERFYTFDGDSADAPGGFSKAENNVNCRCVLELSRE